MGGRAAKIIAAVGAVLLTVAPAAAETEKPISIGTPLQAKLNGAFAPEMLSPKKATPIVLRTAGTFWMDDGSQPPALSEYRLRTDRRMRLDLEEVPVCRGGGRDIRGNGPEDVCRDSIVGRGNMKVDVRFPETAPVILTSKVTVFRGHAEEGRRPTLFLYAFFSAPVTGALVSQIEVKQRAGPYGLEAVAEIPKIAGGSGSITHLGLRFRRGIFTATCPPSRLLAVGQRARFADGTLLQGATFRVCSPSR